MVRLSPLVLLVFLIPAPAFAQKDGKDPSDWDGARLLSKEAKQAADEKMKLIEVKFNTRLEFETVAKLSFEGKDAITVNRFLDKWALDRFDQKGHRGIYVLIVREPLKSRVVHSHALETKKIFDGQDARELQKRLQIQLNRHAYDSAILEATDSVFERLQHWRQTTQKSESDRVDWVSWVLIGGGVFLGLWLLTAVVRGFSGMAPNPEGAGRSGFLSSFLAGLFGAAAGMWLYHSVFGGTQAAVHGAAGQAPGATVTGGDGEEAADQSTDNGGLAGGDWEADETTADGADWGGGGGDW